MGGSGSGVAKVPEELIMKRTQKKHSWIKRDNSSGFDVAIIQAPLEVSIYCTFNRREGCGSYTITVLNNKRKPTTRKVPARNADAVFLAAAIMVLEDWAPDCNVIIWSYNEGLMDDLDGDQLQKWAQAGWRGVNGKPLARAELLKTLYEAIGEREVSFRCDRASREMKLSKSRTVGGLKDWRKRNQGW